MREEKRKLFFLTIGLLFVERVGGEVILFEPISRAYKVSPTAVAGQGPTPK